ncbi:hypothetical protein IQ229_21045 [Nostoc cf. edaphicum LEGE 07299]|uniref:Uncharacterized protein n=1 Tax=Nostoc cf. edaphicum LEGE 07299 TaxID=2777974 RepID=A0ABR9U3S8_9NOSO|nr:hypothetical protein [Nostoc edaphicum]MBE9107323.1 hypothetical protein [Nostoc cf. edaphicum LEGE 07299]
MTVEEAMSNDKPLRVYALVDQLLEGDDRSELFQINSKLWRSHKISVSWQVRSHKVLV